MENFDKIIVDISSNKEEGKLQSTHIKHMPLNMIGNLELNESSTEATKGSEEDLTNWLLDLNWMNFQEKLGWL